MGNPNEVNDPSSTNPPSSPMLDRSMTYSFNKSWIVMGLTFFLVIVPLIAGKQLEEGRTLSFHLALPLPGGMQIFVKTLTDKTIT